jgi:PIN domain nuclease of toxin-antitoxin system
MKILFDTCAFLWLADDAPELSKLAARLFLDEENEVYLSAASTWEISIKYSRGKLQLPDKPENLIPRLRSETGMEALQIDESAALYVSRLPWLHQDPFDRLLVAQAIVHGLTILTPDEAIEQYGVKTLW